MTVHYKRHLADTVKYTVGPLGCQWIGSDRFGLETPVGWPFIALIWTAPDLLGELGGAQGRNRTTDTCIFSAVLYQLSYLGPRSRPLEAATGLPERGGYKGSISGCPG
jgi:hypothetical protein